MVRVSINIVEQFVAFMVGGRSDLDRRSRDHFNLLQLSRRLSYGRRTRCCRFSRTWKNWNLTWKTSRTRTVPRMKSSLEGSTSPWIMISPSQRYIRDRTSLMLSTVSASACKHRLVRGLLVSVKFLLSD